MTKLIWTIICFLVIFNSAVIVVSFASNVKGSWCNSSSCTSSSFVVYECLHYWDEPNGTPCRTNGCILSGITHSYCQSGEEAMCVFQEDPDAQWVYQSGRDTTNCASASTITWTTHTNYNSCDGIDSYNTACETSSCSGPEFTSQTRLGRNVCQ
jgi:hypothetical protein